MYTCTQVPTIYEVSGQEVQFALRVEELFSTITIPEYRQVVVEVSQGMVLSPSLPLSLPLSLSLPPSPPPPPPPSSSPPRSCFHHSPCVSIFTAPPPPPPPLFSQILMVVSTVLERNPEINFTNILKLDEVLYALDSMITLSSPWLLAAARRVHASIQHGPD